MVCVLKLVGCQIIPRIPPIKPSINPTNNPPKEPNQLRIEAISTTTLQPIWCLGEYQSIIAPIIINVPHTIPKKPNNPPIPAAKKVSAAPSIITKKLTKITTIPPSSERTKAAIGLPLSLNSTTAEHHVIVFNKK